MTWDGPSPYPSLDPDPRPSSRATRRSCPGGPTSGVLGYGAGLRAGPRLAQYVHGHTAMYWDGFEPQGRFVQGFGVDGFSCASFEPSFPGGSRAGLKLGLLLDTEVLDGLAFQHIDHCRDLRRVHREIVIRSGATRLPGLSTDPTGHEGRCRRAENIGLAADAAEPRFSKLLMNFFSLSEKGVIKES
jgi:hypothetical protein